MSAPLGLDPAISPTPASQPNVIVDLQSSQEEPLQKHNTSLDALEEPLDNLEALDLDSTIGSRSTDDTTSRSCHDLPQHAAEQMSAPLGLDPAISPTPASQPNVIVDLD